jgi:hypothetical protein
MRSSLRYVLLLPAAAGALAMPVAASAAKSTASGTDATGDGPVLGRDITEVKLSYKTTGTLLVVVTVAGPIDATNADAAVSVSLGSSCKKVIGLGGGLFSDPASAAFSAVKGKKVGKPKKGTGTIKGNVFELKFKNKAFKDWKPKCVAVGLIDPATVDADQPTIFDATDEIKIK